MLYSGAAETLHKDIGGYLTKICQMIMTLGGDVLNFAGDAVLAVWDLTRGKIMKEFLQFYYF